MVSNRKFWAVTGSLGCVTLWLLIAVVVIPLVVVPLQIRSALTAASAGQGTLLSSPEPAALPTQQAAVGQGDALVALYRQASPGIVNIKVWLRRGSLTGQGAGSGFVFDNKGHIVTNNHVVTGARQVTVVFHNGLEAEATVVGLDPHSDLAVLKVDNLPEGVHPLSLGDSDRVVVGETVIAIGNPFGVGSSMTSGIVSGVGRTIESGATPFSIPHAIQTDAAINPGNSGGPLLNLKGEVIGVNAQIATGGVQANAGVGFAIPANIVAQVVPVLIEKGSYEWPWLGVTGTSVNLAIMKANGLAEQRGAYVDVVVRGGPAAAAGLRGSSGTDRVDGVEVPVGGDVIVAIDGEPVADFDSLLVEISSRRPGDRVRLTVLRGNARQEFTVTLAARPDRLEEMPG
ncbi:MAG: trypsin-like peptidase domain-containing protein [Anaerolineae bacterium]|nr:trypsin-like peptidase domain-containing protein [Anaerolineae bacterium]